MRRITQTLPGVKSVGWIDCDQLLQHVDLRHICRMPIPILTTIHPIDLENEAECSCTTIPDGRRFADTATLKFLSHSLIAIHLRLGFVIEDVNGKTYLIGSHEKPFPQVKIDMRCGLPSDDGAGFHYEVTHVAIRTMVPCIAEMPR